MSFAIMSLTTTRRTWVWSSITARFSTTTRVPMWKLTEKFQFIIFRCVWGFNDRNALKICSVHTCMNTQQRHEHINTFKAIKDIAAGQEILIRYGSAKWFEGKSIPYADVDYASTMWRPDLQPLPCRENIHATTGADGRHSFYVPAKLPSGTVMDVSLCVDVSVNVVDQIPFLWDFVIMDITEQTVCVRGRGCRSLLATQYTHPHKYLCVKSCRYASLCHTPHKSRPRPILNSLPCACHSQPWTKMYVGVSAHFFFVSVMP